MERGAGRDFVIDGVFRRSPDGHSLWLYANYIAFAGLLEGFTKRTSERGLQNDSVLVNRPTRRSLQL